MISEHLQPQCRICLETETLESELIQPCMCKGTSQYVHRHCLNKWMNTVSYLPISRIKDNNKKCEICHAYYEFESITIPEIKYNNVRMFFDVLIPILLIHLFGFLFGMLITLNGTTSIYLEIPTYLYVYLFGNLILHFIVGIILVLTAIIIEDSGGVFFCCFLGNDCDNCGEGGIILMLILLVFIATIGFVYLFFLIYEDAYKKAKERQTRVQITRVIKNRAPLV